MASPQNAIHGSASVFIGDKEVAPVVNWSFVSTTDSEMLHMTEGQKATIDIPPGLPEGDWDVWYGEPKHGAMYHDGGSWKEFPEGVVAGRTRLCAVSKKAVAAERLAREIAKAFTTDVLGRQATKVVLYDGESMLGSYTHPVAVSIAKSIVVGVLQERSSIDVKQLSARIVAKLPTCLQTAWPVVIEGEIRKAIQAQ